MAKAAVKATKTPKPQAAREGAAKAGGRSLVWLQGLMCGALAAFAPGTATLFGILLGPAIVALLLDRAPGRPAARAMLLFGLSGSVFPAMALWNAGNGVDAAFAVATDPHTLAIAWSAAGAGWLLAELLPIAVRLALDSASLARQVRLRAMRNRCAAEWGFENLTDPPQ
jgi:hypothetical protein